MMKKTNIIHTRHSIHRRTDMQLNNVADKSYQLYNVHSRCLYMDYKIPQPTHSLLHTCRQSSMENLQSNLWKYKT